MSDQPVQPEISEELKAKPLAQDSKTPAASNKSMMPLLLGGGVGILALVLVGSFFLTKSQVQMLSTQPVVTVLADVYGIEAAEVNGETVKYSDFVNDVDSLTHFYEYSDGQVPPATYDAIPGMVLGRLAFNALLEDVADENDLDVSDEVIEAELDLIATNFGGRDGLAADVEARYAQSLDSYTENVIEPLLLEREIQQALFPEIFKEVSQEELEAIVAGVQARIESGEVTFADMAGDYGTDGTVADGGSLGWFGKGAMVPQFEEKVFSLGVGQIDMVVTDFGTHLVRVDDTRIGENGEEERMSSHILFDRQGKTAQQRQQDQETVDTFFRDIITNAEYSINIPVEDPFAAAL